MDRSYYTFGSVILRSSCEAFVAKSRLPQTGDGITIPEDPIKDILDLVSVVVGKP